MCVGFFECFSFCPWVSRVSLACTQLAVSDKLILPSNPCLPAVQLAAAGAAVYMDLLAGWMSLGLVRLVAADVHEALNPESIKF